MDHLSAIPVEVASPGQSAEAANMALPILNELATMLEDLITTGQENSIDLRRTPLTPQDYSDIHDILGQGELKADLQCLGLTHIRETAVSGLWWITHYSPEGHVQGEFIEVTTCPEMLRISPDDLVSGLGVLRNRYDRHVNATDPAIIEARLQAMGLDPGNRFSIQPNPNHHVKRGNGHAE